MQGKQTSGVRGDTAALCYWILMDGLSAGRRCCLSQSLSSAAIEREKRSVCDHAVAGKSC